MLDIRTMFALAAAVLLVLGSFFLLSWRVRRTERALADWGLGALCGAGGLTLVTLRGQIDPFASIVLANTLVAAGFCFYWIGARRFDRRSLPWRLSAAGVALYFLLFSGLVLGGASLATRILAVTVVTGTLSLVIAWEIHRGGRREPLPARRVASAALAFHAVFVAARSIAAYRDPGDAEFLAGGLMEQLAALEATVVPMIWIIAMQGMATERLHAALQRTAAIDSLTGVLNRRALLHRAEGALDEAVRRGAPVSVLLMDLDRFKRINDGFGHAAGDAVLQAFVAAIAARLRPADLFGRLGGEEFCAVLPGLAPAAALEAGERLRRAFADTRVAHGGTTLRATVSVGVASHRPGEALGTLIARADDALYAAKGRGGNCVHGAMPATSCRAAAAGAPAPQPGPRVLS